jgi:hypothetical protein
MDIDAINAAINEPWPYCEARYIAGREKTNKTYQRNYKAFITWFDRHHFEGNDLHLDTTMADLGVVFVTQHNAEQYYQHCLINTKGVADTVKKHFNSLDWYLKHVENPGCSGLVNSAVIQNSVRQQQINNKERNTVENRGIDPHKGIKDLLSEEDNLKIIKYIYRQRPNDSLDVLFDYTWGRNAGVRGQSSRSFTLSDINLSTGFGPEPVAPRNRTLLLILRKGDIHKDRFDIDRQVGVYRHKDYKQCDVFATGLILLRNLRELEHRIKFHKPLANRPGLWWSHQITRFNKYSAAAHAMKEVLKGTGVELNKVTHHRTQSVLLGGVRGLNDEQISRFTKHKTDKLHTSYTAEVEEEALNVMSGFRKYESRFVKEEFVSIPPDMRAKCIVKLLPRYNQYLQQRASALGDKGRACRTFLLKVLPYLIDVVIQNGIYFIRDFADHPSAVILRVSVLLLYCLCTMFRIHFYY